MFRKVMLENGYREVVEGKVYEKDLDKNRIVEIVKLEKSYVLNLRYLSDLENRVENDVIKTFEHNMLQQLLYLVEIYK